ncbi:MAG: FAD synthase, partial [Candidatus Freyarchaeota archaeon]|nr:FAD synthase [Candidatus Jordarchaeia archaeon]
MKKVMVFGTFDILHTGHLKFLEEAKRLGGEGAKLIVVIARDSTVHKVRGRPPIFSEEDRRRLIEGLKPVDEAILGYEGEDMLKIIEEEKPNIIVLGYDQRKDTEQFVEELRSRGIDAEVHRLPKYGELNSSSII